MMIKKVLIGVLIFWYYVGISFSAIELKENRILLQKRDIKISIEMNDKNRLHVLVVMEGKTVKPPFFKITEQGNLIVPVLRADGLCQVGQFLIQENENGFSICQENPGSSLDILCASAFMSAGETLVEEKKCFNNELFYGMGEVANQLALQRSLYTLYQEAQYNNQANIYIPFFFSSGGDGFYYNAMGRDTIKFKKKNEATVIYTAINGLIDYYYTYEPDFKKMVAGFYHFSGSRSLLPRWAFGYIQSRYGYKSEKEVRELVAQFQHYRIPVSAIVLDLQWFKRMGDLDFDPIAWPDPEKLDSMLEAAGIKLLAISEPFFTKDSRLYSFFEKNKLFATGKDKKTFTWKDWWCFDAAYGAIVNPIAARAPELLGAQYIQMVKRGIDAFWTDLGEPEGVSADVYFNEYTEQEFHNFYNFQWSKLIYNAVSQEFPDRRFWILSRSGFTGSAGYGVSIWSGDCASTFEGLARQPGLGLNAGLAGFSYWGSDVGGFVSNRELPEEELFIRWMQFGAFSPIFRAHGAESAREPWIHGEKALSIIKYYIEWRYRLLPYIYSTAYQTYCDGIPMMRPLFFYHAQDSSPEVRELGNQYYFGDFLLVAPVVEAAAVEPETRVYLPEGEWYDFYTYEKLTPGLKTFTADINKIPVYIKGGAILPLSEGGKAVILLVPGKQFSSFNWYDDDGVSNQYKSGVFEAITITLDSKQVVFSGVKVEKAIRLKIIKENQAPLETELILKPGITTYTFQ